MGFHGLNFAAGGVAGGVAGGAAADLYSAAGNSPTGTLFDGAPESGSDVSEIDVSIGRALVVAPSGGKFAGFALLDNNGAMSSDEPAAVPLDGPTVGTPGVLIDT
jgi:hypothetical protein